MKYTVKYELLNFKRGKWIGDTIFRYNYKHSPSGLTDSIYSFENKFDRDLVLLFWPE